MCGIFGYINHGVPRSKSEILDLLVKGLKRLEYRGYDSAGLTYDAEPFEPFADAASASASPVVAVVKRKGKVANLEMAVKGVHSPTDIYENHFGMAHTRWATHGEPSEVNSHPHLSDALAEFTVVHNGIITNYKPIKLLLESKGYTFISETDTECIAKLIKYVWDSNQINKDDTPSLFADLVERTVCHLEGAFALLFKSSHFPGQTVAARRGSPLLIGIKKSNDINCNERPLKRRKSINSFSVPAHSPFLEDVAAFKKAQEKIEYFFASDASAVVEHTRRVIFLEDEDVAHINSTGSLHIHKIPTVTAGSSDTLADKLLIRGAPKSGRESQHNIQTLEIELNEIMKGAFQHFMQKEIFEQPESVLNTMRGRVNFSEKSVSLGGFKDNIKEICRCRRLMFIACGTSYNSALATRAFLEEMTEMPISIDIASDFMDRRVPIFRDDCCFFVSQSGETADTLSALRYCKSKGAMIVGITNTVGSSLSRESQCGVHINAGPEIGVASTKAYSSQILAILMFGLMMAEDKISKGPRRESVIEALGKLSENISKVLEQEEEIKTLAKDLTGEKSLLVMGRGAQFANCVEGALKIKELTYMHSEGILAGELKHGPLAMIDENIAVIMIMMKDHTWSRSQNALQQVVARKGRPIIICNPGDNPGEGLPEDVRKSLRVIRVPLTDSYVQSIVSVVPLQLLSYHIAVNKGFDVDCPRNLAKSVTVE